MTVLEGYGLTETTAALTVNLPDALKIGTVGRPLPGTAVRVAEDGELLFKGGQVFAGYWRNDEATAEVLERDGWFHTGDVGEVDDEGFVRITGRKKEILVTAGGKNVAPAVLEDRVRAHALVDQCLVVGDGQPFIAALVTLDRESLPAWAEPHGKSRATSPTSSTTPTCGPRSRPRSRTPTRRSPRPSRSASSDPPRRVDRGGRAAHAQPQAQAQRRDAREQGRRRGALRDLIGRAHTQFHRLTGETGLLAPAATRAFTAR